MTAEWKSFVTVAKAMMAERQDSAYKQFGLDFTIQYRWDLDQSHIVFSRAGVPIVHADLQFLGSISQNEGTWLWGWANESIPSEATRRLGEIRHYGEQQGFERLVKPEWVPEGDDGHEVMIVSACILGAPAFFHDHASDLALYFVLDNFRHYGQDTTVFDSNTEQPPNMA